MSAPALETLSVVTLSVAFLASVTGSLHCVGMCGPLRILLAPSRWSGAQYQAGRLSSYLLLGAVGGAIGASLPTWALISIVAVSLSGSLLTNRRPVFFQKIRSRLLSKASVNPLFLGLASGLLPCGLLHAWLAVAVAAGSVLEGALLLFMLWLGTIPALEASAQFLRYPLMALRKRYPRTLPIALVLVALIPIGLRFRLPGSTATAEPQCHSVAEPADEKKAGSSH